MRSWRRALVAVATSFAFAAPLWAPMRASAMPLASAAAASFWYAGTRLSFERPQLRGGALAVGSDDLGLGRFLTKLGATLSYQPGSSTVVITSGDRRTITFTIGDERYDVGGVTQTAPFAPYVSGDVAFVPFLDLARALDVDPVDDRSTTVLQPQIATLDVRNGKRVTVVTLRGASPLHFKRLSDAGDERVSLAFLGTASTLDRDRSVESAGLKAISIIAGGTPKNPTTVMNFEAAPGSTHVLVPSDSPNTLEIAFGPPGVALGGTAIPADGGATTATTPLVVRDSPAVSAFASPAPISGPFRGGMTTTPTALALPVATVRNYSTTDGDDGIGVHLEIAGDVTYEWHRLPDDRWYVDLKPATLAIPTQQIPLSNSAIASLRIKAFVGPIDKLPTVRVAMTLVSPRIVTLVPDRSGLTLAVDRLDDLSATRSAVGEFAAGKLLAAVPLPQPSAPVVSQATPAEAAPAEAAPADPTWKFTPPARAPREGKLIVIDPGHGGSDAGAEHNGLVEAALNLDISKRLRALLVARGWDVKMTRDSDVDVYGPNASAHDELQARDDVANNAGARLFVSVHTNSFTSSDLNGTTTYFYTPESYALASAVHARLVAALPTKDDGIRKDNFYVIHHAKMPSILVETAFISNPGDAALLRTSSFLQGVALSIADGIGDYAGKQATSVSTHADVDVDGQ